MLTCHQYDYIEIVCMYHYPIALTLKSGHVVTGIALDTVRDKQKEECIKLNENGHQRVIVLDNLASLTVMVENPHLKEIIFS